MLLQHWKRQNEEMDVLSSAGACVEVGGPLPSLTNVAGGGVQVEDDFGDLDDTQVAEPGRKSWNEDNVARDMLTRCAADAASRATAKLKAITSRLLQDAAERVRRLAERDDDMMEILTGLVKVVSDSVYNRITNIEQRVQDQWVVFEKVDRK